MCRFVEKRCYKLKSCYYDHFQTNTIVKGMTPLSPKLWFKYYYCFSTGKASELNNTRRLN